MTRADMEKSARMAYVRRFGGAHAMGYAYEQDGPYTITCKDLGAGSFVKVNVYGYLPGCGKVIKEYDAATGVYTIS